MSDGVPSN